MCAMASISTRSSGVASALTSTKVEAGKSPVKNSRRAAHTLTGLKADLRVKVLIQRTIEGSMFEAYSQLPRRMIINRGPGLGWLPMAGSQTMEAGSTGKESLELYD